jgi:molybdopterin converting factor small subunit
MNVAVKVKVKLVGIFRGLSGRNQLLMDLESPLSMRDLVHRLAELFSPEFKRTLIDPEFGDPQPNALILLNGKDVSVLNGLKTKVDDGDEVVLIPVSHGG